MVLDEQWAALSHAVMLRSLHGFFDSHPMAPAANQNNPTLTNALLIQLITPESPTSLLGNHRRRSAPSCAPLSQGARATDL